jgi:hypothetical protein
MEAFGPKYSVRSCQHLVRLILNRNGDVPNFAILLGAGASVRSGVRSGAEMVDEWRSQAYEAARTKESLSEWLHHQHWYGSDDEYGTLFEMIYDQAAQRRVFIEECVKSAHPSWGYVYLTSVLARKVFDVIFTTNFDDLINEACYLYSEGLRPIVSAHDSAISSLRVTAGRPKIIKLHGDFLYDSIKNTVRELESLETNTKRKLTQFAQEYGLIVVGYGGHDRTVIDTLEVLLRQEEYFPHGIYWCIRQGSEIGPRLASLLRRDNVFLVEIDGFDEFMAEVHRAGGFALPEPIGAPLRVARNRAQLFVDVPDSLKQHPIISSDIEAVLDQIDLADSAEYVPKSILAVIAQKKNDKPRALRLWREAVAESPDDAAAVRHFVFALVQNGQDQEAATVIKATSANVEKVFLLLCAKAFEDVIEQATAVLRERPDDLYTRLNRAIAYKRTQQGDKMADDLAAIEKQNSSDLVGYDVALATGVAAIAGDRPRMLTLLKESLAAKKLNIQAVQTFPVFEEYVNDPDVLNVFDKLTRPEDGESPNKQLRVAPTAAKSVAFKASDETASASNGDQSASPNAVRLRARARGQRTRRAVAPPVTD